MIGVRSLGIELMQSHTFNVQLITATSNLLRKILYSLQLLCFFYIGRLYKVPHVYHFGL